jgi:single-strand DNA-binding protein
MNLNKIFVCGRLTRDPELKTTPKGTKVASFAIATNYVSTSKDGEKTETVQFHNCVAFGKTAEVIAQFATKGQELLVEGRSQTREWQAKDGSKRSTTEVIVEMFQFGQKPRGSEAPAESTDEPETEGDIAPEDLPF